MKRIVEIGIQSGGEAKPLTSLPAEVRQALGTICALGRRPGEARKTLYSEIVAAGWGTEIAALFSEHGTNAALPGGVYSLAPFRCYLEAGRVALESAYGASGVTNLLSRLTCEFQKSGGVPAVMTDQGEPIAKTERGTIELPGFSYHSSGLIVPSSLNSSGSHIWRIGLTQRSRPNQ